MFGLSFLCVEQLTDQGQIRETSGTSSTFPEAASELSRNLAVTFRYLSQTGHEKMGDHIMEINREVEEDLAPHGY